MDWHEWWNTLCIKHHQDTSLPLKLKLNVQKPHTEKGRWSWFDKLIQFWDKNIFHSSWQNICKWITHQVLQSFFPEPSICVRTRAHTHTDMYNLQAQLIFVTKCSTCKRVFSLSLSLSLMYHTRRDQVNTTDFHQGIRLFYKFGGKLTGQTRILTLWKHKIKF